MPTPMRRQRADRWITMGLVATVLAAVGCAPSSSKRPTLADYEAVLHPGKALQLDPQIATTGRYQLVDGGKLVLELRVVSGESRIAYDTGSQWSAVIELTPGADGAPPAEATVEAAPAVARVAGEDVVFLATKGRGRIKLARPGAGGVIEGEIDAVFEPAERDLIKLGSFKLAGRFRATLAH